MPFRAACLAESARRRQLVENDPQARAREYVGFAHTTELKENTAVASAEGAAREIWKIKCALSEVVHVMTSMVVFYCRVFPVGHVCTLSEVSTPVSVGSNRRR